MSLTGFINVAPAANTIFTNAGINDMIICTQSNSQKIILGVNSNSIGNITLSSNLTSINGNLQLNYPITMSGITIGPAQPGVPMDAVTYVTNIPGYSNGTACNVFYVASNNSNTNFVYKAGSATIATLTGTGSLAIGTSNAPQATLDIAGITIMRSNVSISNSTGSVTLSNNGNTLYVNNNLNVINTATFGSITGTGTVGCGAITSTGSITTTGTIGLPAVGILGGTTDRVIYYPGSATAYPYSTGINASTLWNSVPVTGQYIWYVNGTAMLTLDTAGNLVANGNVSAYSDARLKENVVKIEDSLNKIKKINGYTYTRNDIGDNDTRFAGVLAQEVQLVLPEVVNTNKETGMMSVVYGNLISLIIEGIKELDGNTSNTIEKLTSTIESMQLDIKNILNRLEK